MELIFALGQFLYDQPKASALPGNKDIIINPSFKEEGVQMAVVNEQEVLTDRCEQGIQQEERRRVIKEFHSFLRK